MEKTKNYEAYTKKLPQPDYAYVVDLFCGCGGMSWGFVNTRQSHIAFKVLAGIDIDKNALATYENNLDAPAINYDIRNIAENPELLRQLITKFDETKCRPLVFIGCAPCQGFSAHRKKDKRDDPRNNLMIAFSKICEYYRPDYVVMENVPEILRGKYREYYKDASEILKVAGYLLSEDVVDLSHYGVPQRRRRAIILGALNRIIKLPFPIFTSESALTVRHSIMHLDPLKSGAVDPNDPDHRAPNHTGRILDRIRRTPIDGGDRRDLSEQDQLECHTAVDNGHTPGFTDVYGRLRWNKPSVTLTAKCSTPSCGRFVHPDQHRNISIREAAILQSFPQSFKFVGPLVSRYRQIGEAVPPLFARFLAWQIADQLRPNRRSTVNFRICKGLEKPFPTENGIPVIDCFCGAGGLSLGFKAAGFETMFAFDNDPDSVKTFNNSVSKCARKLAIENLALPSRLNKTINNRNYIVIGGPPCQGFSQQRRGDEKDPRNNLVLRYAKLISKLKPQPIAVVLENVTYLDSPRGSEILAEYVSNLESQGFAIYRHDLNSADFGVPQLRERIVIVAIDKDFAEQYSGPLPLTPKRWVTIGEVFRTLPDFDDSHLFPKPANHNPSQEGTLNKRRIAYVDMGKGRLSIPVHLQLDCHRKYGGHLDVYGRLDWFSQARTITGGFDSFTRGEYGHPFFHRSITPREAARIQGFPDWFEFHGNRSSVRRQIGNAVPPTMAYAIALGISKVINLNQVVSEWAN